MEIAHLIEIAGVGIVTAASVRAMFGVYSFASRRMEFVRQEQRDIAEYRKYAAGALGKSDSQYPAAERPWIGKRKFRVAARVHENQARDICSFYLAPYDGGPVPAFRPGQFLTFELAVPGQDQPVMRCYSISNSPTEQGYYRVTVKRLVPPEGAAPGTPAGLSSNHFHDHLREGAIVEAYAPAGEFYLDEESERPVVLIAGGVGLTPLFSMLKWLVATKSTREIWLFYGVRNRAEHAMFDQLHWLGHKVRNLRMVVAYSQPTWWCRKDIDYHIEGHVTADMLRPVIEARDCQIYLCGPSVMMDSLTTGLTEIGVPRDTIRLEAFGSAWRPAAPEETSESAEPNKAFQVKFARSGKTIEWSRGQGSLLELAEAHGVKARSGCRHGICGSCATALKGGEVSYLHQPEKEPAAGKCLPCITQPRSDVVLDL